MRWQQCLDKCSYTTFCLYAVSIREQLHLTLEKFYLLYILQRTSANICASKHVYMRLSGRSVTESVAGKLRGRHILGVIRGN